MAIGDTPFLADFPIKTSIYRGFSIATTEYRRVLVIFLVVLSVIFSYGDSFLVMILADDLSVMVSLGAYQIRPASF